MDTLSAMSRQQLENALQAAKERFREALESARHILYRLNAQSGGYDYLSPYFEELTGHPLAEFMQITLDKLPGYFHPDDRQRIFGENGALAAAFRARTGPSVELLLEYRLRKADGSYCWLSDRNTAHFDDNGKLLCFVGSAYDITIRIETEQKLLESERKFRTMFESIQEGYALHEVITDDTGQLFDYLYLDVNPAFENLTGLKRDEIVGRRVSEVFPDLNEECLQAFGRVAQTGEPAERENYVTSRDRYYRAKACSPKTGILAVSFEDITAQKKALQAIIRSEEQLRVLFESSDAGIILVNPSGRITVANGRMAEMFGCDMEELVGSLYPDHVHPDQRGTGDERMRQLIRGEIDHVATERHYIRKDGSGFWGFLSGRRHQDSDGNLVSLVGHITDITERKKSDEALIESELKYRTLFNTIQDAVFLTNVSEDGKIIECNEQLSGYSREELIGKSTVELGIWANLDDRQRVIDIVTKNGYVNDFETMFRKKDGTIFPGSISSKLFPYEKGIALLSVVRDITERKRADEERLKLEQQLLHAQKLESLGVLAGGIAHDFNNILTAIIGNAELALMRLNPESPALENLRRVETAAARAADLARQMLAYSGKGKFVIEPIDLNRLVEEMGHMLEVSITKKAMLRLNLTRPLPLVNVDATQIRQIVMNLVINASEALGDGGGVIAVTTGCLECTEGYLRDAWLTDPLPEGLYVFLEVADTGCGMDSETLGKIFDPFFTTKFTGRGLGMAAVLGIIRGHNGAIKVYSEPGKGSSFKVLLPSGDRPAELFDTPDTSECWQGCGVAMLVDDEETVRAIGAEMLRELGFEVVTANDGRDALEKFQARQDICLAILDLTMPRMDGEQCFRELRQMAPHLRVVISSGFSEYEVAQKFAGKGVAGFIQKPYTMSTLKEALRGIRETTEKEG